MWTVVLGILLIVFGIINLIGIIFKDNVTSLVLAPVVVFTALLFVLSFFGELG